MVPDEVVQETEEQQHFRLRREEKERRETANKQFRIAHNSKLERTKRGGASDDVELVNTFRLLGLDFLKFPRDQAFKQLPEILEGRQVSRYPQKAVDFLHENFEVVTLTDSGGQKRFHFVKPKGEEMNLYSVVAEKAGQKRKVVKEIYEALVSVAHHELREEGRMRLPELGIIRIKYSPAREKRRGVNPFTKEKNFLFKAKPASNKVKFSVAKALKDYANKKIAVKKRK